MRKTRCCWPVAAVPILLAVFLTGCGLVADQPADPDSGVRVLPVRAEVTVEPELLRQIASEPDAALSYRIYFKQHPDLGAAAHMDWIARGRFVVDSLRKAAEASQKRVRDRLDASGVPYRAFWIDNVIVVDQSSPATLSSLMSFEEIAAIRAPRKLGLIEPEKTGPQGPVIQAVESNLLRVNADDVWDMGVRGEGLVVANIDTGVRYTHETLLPHYRGNLGGGNFSHAYNWWDPYGGSPAAPYDYHGHGSHTAGIMVGEDASGVNRIGVAPGAQWMACAGCTDAGCSDVALLECAQFMAAPWDLTGSNPDPDKRPHVVNNSWGDCATYYDPWYQGVVDSWHAAGIYPLFANGNASNCGYSAPPGCNTVGNPGRYGNVTGVGSTGQNNGAYATHSNWGPTDNPDLINPNGFANIKPNVVAPGVNIRSALNASDSDYGSWGGTSMSTPHVAGLVALIWQAAPCLVGNYSQTEDILQASAVPIPYASNCGGEGPGNLPNNATGWGEIDALAAVNLAATLCGPSGTLEGRVTNAQGQAIRGVAVEAGGRTGVTDANGFYRLTYVPVGVFDATFTHFRYLPMTVSVTIVEDVTTTQNAQLSARPSSPISGVVRDGSGHGWPLYAKLEFSVPTGETEAVFTDPVTGSYAADVVVGVEYQVRITAHLAGYDVKTVLLTVVGPTQIQVNQDFTLESSRCTAWGYSPVLVTAYSQDFESSNGGFTTAGTTTFAWGQPTSGPGAAHSGLMAWGTNLAGNYNNNENGYVQSPAIDLSAFVGKALTVAWWQYVNVESGWDNAYVDVSKDGGSNWTTIQGPMSGAVSPVWTRQERELDASFAVFNFRIRFRMTTDSSVTLSGFFVDDIEILRREDTCALTPGGLVFGQVRDLNDGKGLVGARVAGGDSGEATTFEYPDDPALPVGFYFAFAGPGLREFTATNKNYGARSADVNVAADEVVRQDFDLGTGRLVVEPDSLYQRLHAGFMEDFFRVRLFNDGTGAASYDIREVRGHMAVPSWAPFNLANLPQPRVGGKDAAATTTAHLPIKSTFLQQGVAADAVILNEFPTGHQVSWGGSFDGGNGQVWVGETFGGTDQPNSFFEFFLPDGTSTGTASSYFDPAQNFIADGAYDPISASLWFLTVTSSGSCVFEVDAQSGSITGRSICPAWSTSQRGLAFDPLTETFFAGTWNDGSITRFDRDGTILENVAMGLAISGLAYNYTTGHLYVIENGSASAPHLHIVDPGNGYPIVNSFTIPGQPDHFQAGLGIDCEGYAWVVNQKTNRVHQVDVGEPMACLGRLDWVEFGPESGVLEPGEGVELSVRLYADEVGFGHYEGHLRVSSDTPYGPVGVNLTMDHVDRFTVAITTEGEGTTLPSGAVDVWGLDDLTIAIQPAEKYHTHEVYLDGVPQGRYLPELVIPAILQNHQVHVLFGYTCAVDADCVNLENDCLGVCEDGMCLFNRFKVAGDACGDTADSECSAPDTCNGLGRCLPNHVLSGTACNADSDGCTVGDACHAGACVAGGAPDCTGENDACNMGACASTGLNSYACVKDPTPREGALCNADSNGCTVEDTCVAGACVAGAAADCSDLDDACNVGACHSTGLNSFRCLKDPAPMEDVACNADSNGCTVGDACKAGACVAGPAPDCSAENDQCNTGMCASTGDDAYACVKNPVPQEGALCNADSNGCTIEDTCVAGACVAGDAPDCTGMDDACNVGICRSAGNHTYTCAKDPAPMEDVACNADSNGCTVGDACKAGACVAGPAPDCSAENDQCNTGTCASTGDDAYACEKDPTPQEGALCNADSNGCTIEDTCVAGACVAGDAPDCTGMDDACNVGICRSAGNHTYTCAKDPAPMEDVACNADSNGCTVGDACKAGACIAGPAPDCSGQDDQCNWGVCSSTGNTAYACIKNPMAHEGALCNADFDGCTVEDTCVAGACVAGAAPDCTGMNDACNVGVCLSAGNHAFACAKDPEPLEDAACNADSNGCTVGDACVAGACVAGAAPDCSAEDDQCNTGVCTSTGEDAYACAKDPASHQGARCNADSDGCTVGDLCDAGACVAGNAPDCTGLADQCNAGVCQSTGNDQYVCAKDPTPFEGDVCDDGDPCTVAACADGACGFRDTVEDCCGAHEDCDVPLERCDLAENVCEAVHCTACEEDADCGAEGNKCLLLYSGSYCVVACDKDDSGTCPDGATCREAAQDLFLCVPDDGDCECVSKARTLCKSDELVWVNSCGQIGEVIDDCDGRGCLDAACCPEGTRRDGDECRTPEVPQDVIQDGVAPDAGGEVVPKGSGGCSAGTQGQTSATPGLLLFLVGVLGFRRFRRRAI